MKSGYQQTFKRLASLLAIPLPERSQIARRIRIIELDVMLPLKIAALLMLFQSVYYTYVTTTLATEIFKISVENVHLIFWGYLIVSSILAASLFYSKRLSVEVVQWIAVVNSLVDAAFLSLLTLGTGGYDSIVFWLFAGLIIRNAISVPHAVKQQSLNFVASLFYAISAIKGASIAANLPESDRKVLGLTPPEEVGEPLFARLMILWLLAACCHAVQIMIERYRLAAEETREFAARENQLQTAGRLAAQIAHQIKNPLAIINNAAYSLRRALKSGKPEILQQVEIIQEEVSRADQIIVQVMGYSQLSEGRVEKLDVADELDRAVDDVFPAAVKTGIRVERHYTKEFPPLLMQRRHFSEAVMNLLQNARDALNGGRAGRVSLTAHCNSDYSVEVVVEDNGPGIAPNKLESVFEAYYTTKERGTGLGLAIVKHNVELYGGKVLVESELGKGAKFTLLFPAKALIKLGK